MIKKILCIETSTDVCSVCICFGEEILGLREFKAFKHSSHLLPLILESIEASGVNKKELDAICISKGPGSYTGLRVGASTAKGLAFALDIPLIAIDTLKSLANTLLIKKNVKESNIVIMPMLDARRNEVYTAQYDIHLNELLPTQPMILNHYFIDQLSKQNEYYLCGNGSFKAEELCKNLQNTKIITTQCTSEGLCSLAKEAYDKNDFVSLDHFEPNYLKPPNITKPKSPLLKVRTN